jgi:hypothetical protein
VYVAGVYGLTELGVTVILNMALLETKMPRTRGTASVAVSILVSISLLATPIFGNSGVGSGTVVSVDSAHLGTAAVTVGTTVFAGDRLDTSEAGSMQIRAGAARVVMTASSRLVWGGESGAPSATLLGGTAAFSTSRENAFVLHAATAAFKPRGDEPTVANITLLNPKELVVRCSRGAVLIAVEDDVRVVPEGTAYHVVLDPEAAVPPGATPAAAAPASWGQHQPVKTGKSKFIWYAIAFTAVVTGIALWRALESPDRP